MIRMKLELNLEATDIQLLENGQIQAKLNFPYSLLPTDIAVDLNEKVIKKAEKRWKNKIEHVYGIDYVY